MPIAVHYSTFERSSVRATIGSTFSTSTLLQEEEAKPSRESLFCALYADEETNMHLLLVHCYRVFRVTEHFNF